jgi:hypothetical protein
VLQGLGALVELGCVGVRKQGVATATVHINVPLGAEDIVELLEESSGVVRRMGRFAEYLRSLNRKLGMSDDEPPGTVVPLHPTREDE